MRSRSLSSRRRQSRACSPRRRSPHAELEHDKYEMHSALGFEKNIRILMNPTCFTIFLISTWVSSTTWKILPIINHYWLTTTSSFVFLHSYQISITILVFPFGNISRHASKFQHLTPLSVTCVCKTPFF